MAEISFLSFEQDGENRNLYTKEEIIRAIGFGEIARETPVTLYLSDKSSVMKPAGEHEKLAGLFPRAEAEPVAEDIPPPIAEDRAMPVPPPPREFVPDPQPEPHPAPEPYSEPEPAAMEPAPYQPMPFGGGGTSSGGGSGGAGKGIIIALLIGVVLLLAVIFGMLLKGDDTPDTAAVEAAPVQDVAAVEAMDDATLAEQSITLYMARWGNVRSSPNGSAKLVGRLERGEAVTGIMVPSQSDANFKWLRLTSGLHQGAYVSAINLIGNQPPSINAADAGEYYLVGPATLYAGPSTSSGVIAKEPSTLPPGEKVIVFGTVNDMAEIEHKDGGVAYIEWGAIYGEYSDGTGDYGGEDIAYLGPAAKEDLEANAAADAAAAAASAAASPSGGNKYIAVNNRCNTDKTVIFTYKVNGRWSLLNSQIWTVKARRNTYLGTPNRDNIVISGTDAYFYESDYPQYDAAHADLSFPSFDTVYFNGTTRRMTRATPSQIGGDSYIYSFC